MLGRVAQNPSRRRFRCVEIFEDRHADPSDAPTWIGDSLASATPSQDAVVRAHQVLVVRGSSSLKHPPFAHVRATCVVSLILV